MRLGRQEVSTRKQEQNQGLNACKRYDVQSSYGLVDFSDTMLADLLIVL